MVLRRELNCKTLIEELKRQRAPDAEESRKSERLDARIMNAPTEIVIMRSHKQHFASNRNRFMNKTKTAALSNEDKHFISRSEVRMTELTFMELFFARHQMSSRNLIRSCANCRDTKTISASYVRHSLRARPLNPRPVSKLLC